MQKWIGGVRVLDLVLFSDNSPTIYIHCADFYGKITKLFLKISYFQNFRHRIRRLIFLVAILELTIFIMNSTFFDQLNKSFRIYFNKTVVPSSGQFNNYTHLTEEEERPEIWQIWLFGLLIVTGSSFAAPLGILLVPFLRKSLYDRFMTFLVALGIGSMSGSCLFILIPQAFNITKLESFDYTTKSWLILCSIYGFLIVDRIFQFGIEFRRRKKIKRKIHMSTLKTIMETTRQSQIHTSRRKSNDTEISNIDKQNDEIEIAVLNNPFIRSLSTQKRLAIIPTEKIDAVQCQLDSGAVVEISLEKINLSCDDENGKIQKAFNKNSIKRPSLAETEGSDLSSRECDHKNNFSNDVIEKNVIENMKTEVASVVYMILFGCSANNFVDGMSIGAAFSDGLIQGISIGLAVFTQQLPEGLGILAIVVNSGLGIKKTLIYNIIPIVLSYLGFIAGLFLDNLDDSYDNLIFSISAGMYFYIFLGTLIPESRQSVNELLRSDAWEAVLSTVLQVSGVSLGVFFMFFMSSFSDDVE